jgi:hypothetical protein
MVGNHLIFLLSLFTLKYNTILIFVKQIYILFPSKKGKKIIVHTYGVLHSDKISDQRNQNFFSVETGKTGKNTEPSPLEE